MIWHDSQITIRRVKSLHVSDFSWAVLNSIHDNTHYMEEDIKNIYRHDHAMLKVALLLRHINFDHVYDMISRRSRVLYELESLPVGTGCRKVITHCVQVGLGVRGTS
jgi:hypothetical protein